MWRRTRGLGREGIGVGEGESGAEGDGEGQLRIEAAPPELPSSAAAPAVHTA